MKILLVRPPRIKQAITLSDFMFSEPLGLEMICGALKGDHEVEIFDMMIEEKSLLEKIKDWKPDTVGITSLCIDVNMVLSLCGQVKQASPQIVTVVGGTQAFLHPQAFFHETVDHVFHYTRKKNLMAFYRGLQKGELVKIDGILSRAHGYESTGTPGTNEYFLPDRGGTARYRNEYSYFGYRPAAIMEFGTGCEKVCDFCLRWRIEGAKETLIDEGLTRMDLMAIKEPTIMLIDNDLFSGREKIESLIRLVKELGIKKNLIGYGSVAGILHHREYIKELGEIGLKALLVGYETFSDEEMTRYQKSSTPADNFMAAEILREAGIDVWASFMAHPDWDEGDFKLLRKTVKKLDPQITSISPLTPFPNLPLFEEYKERLLYPVEDYEKWSFGQVMIRPSRLSLGRYYFELLKTNIYVNLVVNNNTEMIKTFGGKNSLQILKGSLKAAKKYLLLMMKSD